MLHKRMLLAAYVGWLATTSSRPTDQDTPIKMSNYALVLAQLEQPGMPIEWIQRHYGIDLSNAPTSNFIRSIIEQSRIRCRIWNAIVVDRVAVELALQKMGLQSLRFAAASYGMTEASLRNTLLAFASKGLARVTDQALETSLVETKLLKQTLYLFPEVDKKTYVTRTGLCRDIHACIRSHLGVTVAPLYCTTSVVLGEIPLEFASDFDLITQAPIGLKHRVWLDFHKPLSLAPDYCAPQTAKVIRALQDHVIGGYSESNYSADDMDKISRASLDV
jgi:hypothetical protein